MSYKRLKPPDVPIGKRVKPSRFEKTPEWERLKADLDKGFHGGAIQITLTQDEKRKYGIKARRTVNRVIQKYLTTHKLPYSLKSFSSGESDCFLIVSSDLKS
jgi:hypothetical protein